MNAPICPECQTQPVTGIYFTENDLKHLLCADCNTRKTARIQDWYKCHECGQHAHQVTNRTWHCTDHPPK